MKRSEIMEVVCEVADMAVLKHADVEGFSINVMVDGEMRYTEDAQVIFDGYYDNYDEFATKWVNKYPNTTQAELKQLLMEEAGLYTPPKPIEWSDCAIAFYWEGVEEDLDGDIVFDPGYYMWNDHTILNWKTMTPEFDFVYLIQATGERVDEGGIPKYPDLYRFCDKGVVVRKLSREHENGGPRPTYENRSNYVFIVDVPGKVRISGEEFHFFEKIISR